MKSLESSLERTVWLTPGTSGSWKETVLHSFAGGDDEASAGRRGCSVQA